MINLQPEQFASVLPLFASMEHHLAILSTLTGCAEGRVIVDSALNPRSALVWVSHRLYFGGDPENAAFNHALSVWLTGTVFPEAKDGVFTLYPPGPEWQRAIETSMLPDHLPISANRKCYELDLAQPAPPVSSPARLPDGFVLRAVDRALAEITGMEHLDDLREEMQSERPSVDDFLRRSFGSVIIDTNANRLVTWCLSEYNCAGRCEVGIATMEGYQRQGLATAAGRGFAAQARAAGIRRIGWHCWKDNLPSAATARALGYSKVMEDVGYFLYTDRAMNLAVHGDVRLEQGDYLGAIEWFERAFQLGAGKSISWAFVRAACASVRLGDCERGFRYLNRAVDNGFTNVGWMTKMDYLDPLRGTAEWNALVERFNLRNP